MAYIENSTQGEQNTHFFQVPIEHSSRRNISCAKQERKQTSTDLKESKSYMDRNGIIVEISNRKIRGQSPNPWKLHNTLLNTPWVKEEISKEILKSPQN